MEVEFMAEFTEPMSRNQTLQIVKRKRTKRRRPYSGNTSPDADCLIDDFTPDHQSPVTSPEMSSEEDEDMANCLILLAQSESPVKEDKSGKKTEIYVYECKTCNRTFPSFQALGGHRASHKKQKLNVEEKKSIPVNIPHEENDQQKTVVEDEENNTSMIINNKSVQTGTTNNKIKVHECLICGSEFSSGQALGGHMRKHRPVPPSVNRLTESVTEKEKSTGASTSALLSLDLNFPPPEVVDDVVQSKFQFGSSQQHLVFSSPALVDCHY